MPPELVAYAKEHDIQLLTHNDPASKFAYPGLSATFGVVGV